MASREPLASPKRTYRSRGRGSSPSPPRGTRRQGNESSSRAWAASATRPSISVHSTTMRLDRHRARDRCAPSVTAPRKVDIARAVPILPRGAGGAFARSSSTVVRYGQTRRLLTEHFGEDLDLEAIGPRDAEGWRSWLVDAEYAPAKVSREAGIARMVFRAAVRSCWIDTNPFEDGKAGSQQNPERLHYVTPEDTARLLDTTADHDRRCIIALARWGGLRTPSETQLVRWMDVDWDRNRMRVRSPKTEAHAGKGVRTIPLFPRLRAVLVDAFAAAEDETEHVIARYRNSKRTNLRTHLLPLIDRAGCPPGRGSSMLSERVGRLSLPRSIPRRSAPRAWATPPQSPQSPSSITTWSARKTSSAPPRCTTAQNPAHSRRKKRRRERRQPPAAHGSTDRRGKKLCRGRPNLAPDCSQPEWAGGDSNPGPFACKANALAS